jgi:adenine-specific DNA-methyltransferase
MLDLGIELNHSIREENIDKKRIYFVDETRLIACFDEDISEDIIEKIASFKPERAVFRDSSFKNDETKLNLWQNVRDVSPKTIIKVL